MNKRMRVTAFNSDGTTTQFDQWDMTLIYQALRSMIEDIDGMQFPTEQDKEDIRRAEFLTERIAKLGGLDE